MKTLTLILLATSAAAGARAQGVIDWFTLDAAGGAGASANYVINDTLGQADAGGMTSANYEIIGGFWALTDLGPQGTSQIISAPILNIAIASPTQASLFWASPSTGFVLQENSNIADTAAWSDVGLAISDNGSIRSVLVLRNQPARFYRLRHP